MKITTPTATCTSGHTHVSWYCAQVCDSAEQGDPQALPTTYAPLAQAERTAVTGLPCSR